MPSDRYRNAVLTVIAAALVVIAVQPWLPGPRVLDAVRPGLAEAQGGTPKYEVSIPKSWGKLVAFSNNNLLLEAPDQTLRIVDVEGKSPEYPRVKVLVRWQ
jgi:hypothetical protein